jgi:hypothetical protein
MMGRFAIPAFSIYLFKSESIYDTGDHTWVAKVVPHG